MPAEQVRDKHGEPIHEDDSVSTRYRGGSHRGRVIKCYITPLFMISLTDQVEKIVTDQAGAREEEVANPPKVCMSQSVRHETSNG